MYPKIAARRMAPIAAIARRTVVDRLGNIGPRGAGAGGASMDSALDRLAALRAELHVAGDLVAIRAPAGLSRAAFAAELQARRDGLPALDARLAPRRDRRVGAAVPAELHVRGVQRPALRAGPHLLLLRRLRDHAAHLGAHRIAHADARAEADAGPGGAGGIRGTSLPGVREGELLVGRGPERPDELVDERLGILEAVPEVPEGAELDHVEVRVLEQERVLGPELAVEDALLEVVHLRLLHDAGEGLDELA